MTTSIKIVRINLSESADHSLALLQKLLITLYESINKVRYLQQQSGDEMFQESIHHQPNLGTISAEDGSPKLRTRFGTYEKMRV